MNFAEQFKAARRVGVPLLAIQTHDAKSTISNVRAALNGKAASLPLIRWDVMRGAVASTEPGNQQLAIVGNGENPGDWSANLAEVLRRSEKFERDVILFISNAHLYWNETEIKQGIWNLRDVFKSQGNMLLLLCAPGSVLPAELLSDVMTIDEPLPTREQLAEIVQQTYKWAKLEAPDADVQSKATDALIGLPSFPAEQATALCLDVKANALNTIELWDRKRQIINQTPGLSWYAGDASLEDVGGLDNIREFISALMQGKDAPRVILRLDEIEKAFAGTGTDLSGVKTELTGGMLSWMEDRSVEGIIEIGLPGVSKSALIYALSNHYKVPCINFDLAAMQNSLVGQSGTNLRTAQKAIDAISDGRVLAIGTCNGIDALPPELRRRFNLGIFFFDAPTAKERAAIWKIYLKKYSLSPQTLPNDTGWTGAEIKECCKKAYRLQMPLAKAAEYIVPVTRSAADRIRQLRISSHSKYLSASHAGVYQYVETPVTPELDGRTMRDSN